MESLNKLKNSFKYAIAGLKYGIKTQRNMRIHIVAAFFVMLLGYGCKLEASNFCIVITVCFLVPAFECINTALEAMCDKMGTEFDPYIKIAKDICAAAVLIVAILAIIIGIVIFIVDGFKIAVLFSNPLVFLCSFAFFAVGMYWAVFYKKIK